jgi:hypothetical protein
VAPEDQTEALTISVDRVVRWSGSKNLKKKSTTPSTGSVNIVLSAIPDVSMERLSIMTLV